MKIFKDQLYILVSIPGISGFQQWDKREYRVILGSMAKSYSHSDLLEFNPSGAGLYRCEDGHLPDYQPKMSEDQALIWLRENKQPIYLLNPEDYVLFLKLI